MLWYTICYSDYKYFAHCDVRLKQIHDFNKYAKAQSFPLSKKSNSRTEAPIWILLYKQSLEMEREN